MGQLIPFIQKEFFTGEYPNNIDKGKDVGKQQTRQNMTCRKQNGYGVNIRVTTTQTIHKKSAE